MPELIPDQVAGVEWILNGLSKHKGVILADRVGFGKTAQAIEVLKKAVKKKPVLIIAPAYIVLNWLDELGKWGVDDPLCVIDSGKQIIGESKIYIGSYNMVSKEAIFKQLFKKEFSLIIADEIHLVKSWNSIRSRRILGTYQAKKTNLLNRTDYILGLTGTPILNRIDEIYNIIIRIAPEVLHHIKKIDFLHKFAAHVEYTPWGVQHRGVKNEHELREALKPVLLSRKKIKGLPPLVTHPVKMKIKGAELRAFIKEEERFLHAHGITETEIDTLQSVNKLDASQIARVRQRVALFKIPVFLEALQDIFEKTEQAILYTYHKAPQEALYTEVKKKFSGKKIAVINGGVLNKKRFEIIKKYQAGAIDIIIATIGALKEGVNLTAGNYVLFLELSWTPADIEQAIARLHRKGQESTVFAYFFYFTSGIDRHLIRLIQDKRKVIDKVVG